MHARLVAVACGALLGTGAAPGTALGTFAPPVPVSGRSVTVDPVALVFDADGRALAAWRGLRGLDPDEAVPFHATAWRSTDGAWHRGPRFGSRTVALDVTTVSGRNVALASARQEPAGRRRTRTRLTVALAPSVGEPFGRPRTLDLGPPIRVTPEGATPGILTPRVGGTPGGDLLVAWTRTAPERKAGIWLARRRPDGRWLRSRHMGLHGAEPLLSVQADGRALLAWRRGTRRGATVIEARVRDANGRWSGVETVRRAVAGVDLTATGLAGTGDRHDVGIVETRRSLDGVDARHLVLVRVPGTGWRSLSLAEYRFVPTGATSFVTDGLRVLPLGTGEPRHHVAWPALDGSHVRTALAEVTVTGGVPVLGPVGLISDPDRDVSLQDVSTGPGGRLAVAWFELGAGPGAPAVWTGTGPPTLPGSPGERALPGTQVALDPVGGGAVAIWAEGTSADGYRLVASTGF